MRPFFSGSAAIQFNVTRRCGDPIMHNVPQGSHGFTGTAVSLIESSNG